MPPAYANRKLTPEQIETIKNWIDSGAKWETHWAFVPPKRPDAPVVKDEKWVRNPIDQFVLAKLEKEGLHPAARSGQADAAPPCDVRSDGLAANAGRTQRVSGRQVSRCL